MVALEWDKTGERTYETGVSKGVLYLPDGAGAYTSGYAWNGLTTITESPSGADSNPQYADNRKYLNLISVEQFGGTIEAFTYPEEFEQCDGTASLSAGITIGQQSRKSFGLAYQTLKGNDTDGTDFGYKIHLVYGATAAPSQRAYATVNDSPEAMAFSWDISTTAVDVPGHKPTATLVIDSTKVDAAALATLEGILYGTAGVDPRLPLPAEIADLFDGTVTQVSPAAPTQAGNVLTIPTTAGVVYTIDGRPVTGSYTMTEDTIVVAQPTSGNVFAPGTDNDWAYDYTP